MRDLFSKHAAPYSFSGLAAAAPSTRFATTSANQRATKGMTRGPGCAKQIFPTLTDGLRAACDRRSNSLPHCLTIQPMTSIENQLDYSESVAEWLLDLSELACGKHNYDDGLKYAYTAAAIFSRQNRILTCPRLEKIVRTYSELTMEPGQNTPLPTTRFGKESCLHVLTEAQLAGGVLAMATRWILNDCDRVHHLALLDQKIPLPESLATAVELSGGTRFFAPSTDSIVARARWLRSLAAQRATYVVLHIDVSDVICGVAFGVPGGPPVLLVNHTAHTFWTGSSYIDLLLNCRGSKLEAIWARAYRANSRIATVPIPLIGRSQGDIPEPRYLTQKRRQNAKVSIAIPADSVTLLSIGASFKYSRFGELDFVEVVTRILARIPNAHLLLVGVRQGPRWQQVSELFAGRVHFLGVLPSAEIPSVHQATDIYLEAFPFGTTTALLEAGLEGVPAVLAPTQCPPPYGSDGVALDNLLDRPHSINNYIDKVVELASNSQFRKDAGDALRDSINSHHVGNAWRQYLCSALASLPANHRVYEIKQPSLTPKEIYHYWSTLLPGWTWSYQETLERSVRRALSMKVNPRVTRKFWNEAKKFDSIRTSEGVPLPLLTLLCNLLNPIFPIKVSQQIFIFVSFVSRGSLYKRLRAKLRTRGLSADHQAAYSEYRRLDTIRGATDRPNETRL
jgi:glycosyltransferase involved in cell wall biosynthesis